MSFQQYDGRGYGYQGYAQAGPYDDSFQSYPDPYADYDGYGNGFGDSQFFAEGPDRDGIEKMRRRSCTDLSCAVLFLLALVGMGYLASYGQAEGDIRRLSHGFDFEGKLCGVAAGVEHKKMTYFCTFPNATSLNLAAPICIGSCPATDATVLHCPTAESATDLSISYAEQKSVQTVAFAGKYCLPLHPALNSDFLSSGKFQKFQALIGLVEGLRPAWWVVLSSAAVGGVLAIVYVVVLRLCGKCVIWTLSVATLLGLLGVVLVCFGYQDALEDKLTEYGISSKRMLAATTAELVAEKVSDATALLGDTRQLCGIGAALVAALLCVLLCLGAGRLNASIGIVQESVGILGEIPGLLFVPICFAVVQIGLLSALIYGFLLLMSAGKLEHATYELATEQVVSGVNRRFTYDPAQTTYMIAWLFGSIWTVEVMWAIGQFTIAFSVVVWYFSPETESGKRDLPYLLPLTALWNGSTYHLGSMAWSGLLFGLCRAPASLCGLFDRGDDSFSDGSCRSRVCCCCDWLNSRVFKYVISLGFPDLAVNSAGFQKAAISARKATHSAEGAYRDLRLTLYLFLTIGVAAAGAAGYLLGVYLVTSTPDLMAEASGDFVQNPLLVGGVSAVAAAGVAMALLAALARVADALLYCAVADEARGAGYDYAPESVQNLLYAYAYNE